MQNPDETNETISRKISHNDEAPTNYSKTNLKKKTSQLSQLPAHKIRSKKLSKSSATNCTGGGIVIAHEKQKPTQPPREPVTPASIKMLSSQKFMEMKLPDKIDLPKLALDQLSNSSSNNSPRNFILSPRSQKSLFTAAQSPLAAGKCNLILICTLSITLHYLTIFYY